ncbi:hypothetical protein [Eubacterium sp.]
MYQASPGKYTQSKLDPATDTGIATMKMYNKLFDLAFAEPGRQLDAEIKYTNNGGGSGTFSGEKLLNFSLQWDGGLSGCVMKALTFQVDGLKSENIKQITNVLFGVYVDPSKYEEEMTALGYDVSGLSPSYYYVDYGYFWIDRSDSNTGYSYKEDRYSFQCYDAISQLSLPSTLSRTHKMWKYVKSQRKEKDPQTEADFLVYYLLTGTLAKVSPQSKLALKPNGEWKAVYEGLTAREAIDDFALALNWLIVAQQNGYLIINSRKINWNSDANNIYFTDENYNTGVWLKDTNKCYNNDFGIYNANETNLVDYDEMKPVFLKNKIYATATDIGDVTYTTTWKSKPSNCDESEIRIEALCIQGNCKYVESKWKSSEEKIIEEKVKAEVNNWSRRWLKVNDGDENYKVDFWYLHSFEANSMPRVAPCDPVKVKLAYTDGYTRAMSNTINYEGGFDQTVAFDDLSLHGKTLDVFYAQNYYFDDGQQPNEFKEYDWIEMPGGATKLILDGLFDVNSAVEIKFKTRSIAGTDDLSACQLWGDQGRTCLRCSTTYFDGCVYTDDGTKWITPVKGDFSDIHTAYECRDFVNLDGTTVWSNIYDDKKEKYPDSRRLLIGNSTYFGYAGITKIYRLKYWDDRTTGILKYDLIPGKIGTQVLFYNRANGSYVLAPSNWTAGNDNDEVTE